MSADRTVCRIPLPARQSENRGLAWVIGAFVICPCHLPLTLGVAATVLSGTVVGAFISGHVYIAGTLITAVWVAATWRGVRFLRLATRAPRDPKPSSMRLPS